MKSSVSRVETIRVVTDPGLRDRRSGPTIKLGVISSPVYYQSLPRESKIKSRSRSSITARARILQQVLMTMPTQLFNQGKSLFCRLATSATQKNGSRVGAGLVMSWRRTAPRSQGRHIDRVSVDRVGDRRSGRLPDHVGGVRRYRT